MPSPGAPSSGNAASPLLEARSLGKLFRESGSVRPRFVAALTDCNFALYPGQLHAIVGESGSGKSTLARILARIERPSSGSVWFQGRDTARFSRSERHAFRSKVQMVFQDPFASLNPVHSIRHHLERPIRIRAARDSSPPDVPTEIPALLKAVGLPDSDEFAHRYPHELSGGQRQRVAIARALALRPEVLLADEPTSMLDVSIRIGILNLLKQLREERGIACLYITHDIASARYVADEISVMYGGHIVEAGETEALLLEPAHPYTRLLLASVPGSHLAPEPETRRTQRATAGGCPFTERCPRVQAQCSTRMPAVRRLTAEHWARCHALE